MKLKFTAVNKENDTLKKQLEMSEEKVDEVLETMEALKKQNSAIEGQKAILVQEVSKLRTLHDNVDDGERDRLLQLLEEKKERINVLSRSLTMKEEKEKEKEKKAKQAVMKAAKQATRDATKKAKDAMKKLKDSLKSVKQKLRDANAEKKILKKHQNTKGGDLSEQLVEAEKKMASTTKQYKKQIRQLEKQLAKMKEEQEQKAQEQKSQKSYLDVGAELLAAWSNRKNQDIKIAEFENLIPRQLEDDLLFHTTTATSRHSTESKPSAKQSSGSKQSVQTAQDTLARIDQELKADTCMIL